MEVEWMLLADSAEVINGKVYAMGAGWDIINLANALPSKHRFSIVIAFQVPWNETNQQHHIEIELLNPDGRQILMLQGELEVGRPAGINPGTSQRVPIAFSLDTEFDVTGSYALFARVDGEKSNNFSKNRKMTFQVAAPPAAFVGNPIIGPIS